jgi:hypothetical protein
MRSDSRSFQVHFLDYTSSVVRMDPEMGVGYVGVPMTDRNPDAHIIGTKCGSNLS